MQAKSRKILFLIAAICGLPIVFSYAAFYLWQPEKTMNYGELLAPPVVLQGALTDLDGNAFPLAALRGKWVLLYANRAACDEACRQLIYYMRQVRTAQGEGMNRIERLWVITDAGTPDGAWLKDYPGMKIARGTVNLPAAAESAQHIYLVDPLGNLILRYPEQPEAKRIIKDLTRLMKYSNVDRAVK